MKKIVKYIFIITIFITEIKIMVLMRKHRESSEIRCYNKLNKLEEYRHLLAIWSNNLIDHNYVSDYLIKEDIHNIAIYGTDIEADILDKELLNTPVRVVCFMDSDSKKLFYRNKEVFNVEQVKNMEEIDAIIVSSAADFDSIKTSIEKVVDKKILSLTNIVFNVKKMGEQK